VPERCRGPARQIVGRCAHPRLGSDVPHRENEPVPGNRENDRARSDPETDPVRSDPESHSLRRVAMGSSRHHRLRCHRAPKNPQRHPRGPPALRRRVTDADHRAMAFHGRVHERPCEREQHPHHSMRIRRAKRCAESRRSWRLFRSSCCPWTHRAAGVDPQAVVPVLIPGATAPDPARVAPEGEERTGRWWNGIVRRRACRDTTDRTGRLSPGHALPCSIGREAPLGRTSTSRGRRRRTFVLTAAVHW
jgi:hypothetical protein